MSVSLSLYSIPVVWFTTFYPMNMKFALIDKTIGYNNLQPRSNTKRLLEDPKVPREIALRAERLEGAHLNGNEVFPLWVAAVLAGNHAGISNGTLNFVSAAFISFRLLYNYVYITQSTSAISWVRSTIFFTSLGFPMYLLIKAGNIVRNAA
ncbi:hypothetical protein M0805_008715 [Coniferiporia weirii]|nr:hypothetical protein M0805_008715 [Coniferiporia weirii]